MPLAEHRHVPGDRQMDLGDAGIAGDPLPVAGRRGAARAGLRGDDRDDDLGPGEGKAASRHEPVAAVVARAAQDDDRAAPPSAEVRGERPDRGCDGGPGVLHQPRLGIAEGLGPPVGAGHRLGRDRPAARPGRPSVGAGRAGPSRRSTDRRRAAAEPRRGGRVVALGGIARRSVADHDDRVSRATGRGSRRRSRAGSSSSEARPWPGPRAARSTTADRRGRRSARRTPPSSRSGGTRGDRRSGREASARWFGTGGGSRRARGRSASAARSRRGAFRVRAASRLPIVDPQRVVAWSRTGTTRAPGTLASRPARAHVRPRHPSGHGSSATARSRGTASSAMRCSAGSQPGRHRPATIRPRTRRTFVSTAPTGIPNASAATARAVYGPTPGRASQGGQLARDPPAVIGHDRPRRALQVDRRAGCSQVPATRAGRPPAVAAASDPTVGKRVMNAVHASRGPRGLRLLGHRLRHEDRVRIAGAAERQVAAARPRTRRGSPPGQPAGTCRPGRRWSGQAGDGRPRGRG